MRSTVKTTRARLVPRESCQLTSYRPLAMSRERRSTVPHPQKTVAAISAAIAAVRAARPNPVKPAQ